MSSSDVEVSTAKRIKGKLVPTGLVGKFIYNDIHQSKWCVMHPNPQTELAGIDFYSQMTEALKKTNHKAYLRCIVCPDRKALNSTNEVADKTIVALGYPHGNYAKNTKLPAVEVCDLVTPALLNTQGIHLGSIITRYVLGFTGSPVMMFENNISTQKRVGHSQSKKTPTLLGMILDRAQKINHAAHDEPRGKRYYIGTHEIIDLCEHIGYSPTKGNNVAFDPG